MQGVAVRIAHQSKAAREHATIGQRRQQLAAMGDPRFQPLHRRQQGAAGALGEALGAFAVARDGVALGLRVGELRGLQPDLQPCKAIPAMAQQRAGGEPDALAGTGVAGFDLPGRIPCRLYP